MYLPLTLFSSFSFLFSTSSCCLQALSSSSSFIQEESKTGKGTRKGDKSEDKLYSVERGMLGYGMERVGKETKQCVGDEGDEDKVGSDMDNGE
jgi:hypothetical protein